MLGVQQASQCHMGAGVFLSPLLCANMARCCEHVSHSIRRMDQNICSGSTEEEAVGESQLLNHVGSRRIGRQRTELGNAGSVASCCTATDRCIMLAWLEDSNTDTLQ